MLTRVIELSSLSNAQSTTTNDEDLLHIDEVLATCDGAALQVCLGSWCDLALARISDLCQGSRRFLQVGIWPDLPGAQSWDVLGGVLAGALSGGRQLLALLEQLAG